MVNAETGTVYIYPSGPPEFTPGFLVWVPIIHSCMFVFRFICTQCLLFHLCHVSILPCLSTCPFFWPFDFLSLPVFLFPIEYFIKTTLLSGSISTVWCGFVRYIPHRIGLEYLVKPYAVAQFAPGAWVAEWPK